MARADYQLLTLQDFSGGLNLRDAPSEVGDTEATDCLNITCDERGGVVKRLGRVKYNATQLGTTKIDYTYFSEAKGVLLCQQGANLYATDGGGAFGAPLYTFSTNARIQCVDFLNRIVVIHPNDGCLHYDGTSVVTDPQGPKGNCIAVWQNALWTAGDPANPTRLTRSDIGAISWPVSSMYVDVRDRSDAPITAIRFSQGLDTQGRPGLLVFKANSLHRVHDATTGAYTTLSTDAGASGPMCITSMYSTTAFINTRGIYVTDGLLAPKLVSEKLQPLFTPTQLKYSSASNWWAHYYRDRFIFAINTSGGSANDLLLEYHPDVGWIVPHNLGVTSGATWIKNDQKLYTASTTQGYLYETFKGWSDDGAAIGSRWQSRWFEPVKGYEMRMRRLLVTGRGVYNLYVKPDYTLGAGIFCPVSLVAGTTYGHWNDNNWNEFNYGPGGYEDYQSFYSLGHARSVAFRIEESSTTSATGPSVLPGTATTEVGAFAMYGLHLDLVNLSAA